MANGYIPRPDGEFDAWFTNFAAYVNAHLLELGLVAGDVTAMNTSKTNWDSALPAHVTAQAAAEAARQLKTQRRAESETAIRFLVGLLQTKTQVDDAERQAMGITVRDTEQTPIGPPTTKPVLQIDTRDRLRHTIGFADEGTPTSKGKPFGVSAAELHVKIGDPPPIDASQTAFLATDTRTPYVADFDGGDANKTAHYMARWLSTRGEPGPWSETVSATIGA